MERALVISFEFRANCDVMLAGARDLFCFLFDLNFRIRAYYDPRL